MLTKKQKEIAEYLFKGGTFNAELMKKYKISEKQYQKLVESIGFKEELVRLGGRAVDEAFMIISRYKPIAARALVDLLESEKPDVARRAALDIINHNMESDDQADSGSRGISDEEVWRQIKVLANRS